MTASGFALGSICCANGVLADGVRCEQVEYAQLKDSNKKELTAAYCSAIAKAELNKDLRAIKKELFDKQLAIGANTSATMKEMREYGDAQVSCLSASEAASAMLQKKYNSKPPKSCE